MSAENKLIDNKQMVHIVSEVIVLLGMSFYFSSKNKTLQSHIENLSQRLEEQEDRIQKMENLLNQIPARLNDSLTAMNHNIEKNMEECYRKIEAKQAMDIVENTQKKTRKIVPKAIIKIEQQPKPKKHTTPIITEMQELPKTTQVDFNDISDSELDNEIQDELNELTEDENSLKKQN